MIKCDTVFVINHKLAGIDMNMLLRPIDNTTPNLAFDLSRAAFGLDTRSISYRPGHMNLTIL